MTPRHPNTLLCLLAFSCLLSLTSLDCTPPCSVQQPPVGGGGELMLPGSDCIKCHTVGGSATKSPLSIAGTVFLGKTCPDAQAGVTVSVTDAKGRSITLTTNEVGNFFSSEALSPPFTVSITQAGTTTKMKDPAPHGSCNLCHNAQQDGYVAPQ